MNQFEDGGNSVAEQARGLKEEAKDRASSTAKEQMDTRSTQAGEQMQKVAEAMRQDAPHHLGVPEAHHQGVELEVANEGNDQAQGKGG